VVTQPDQPRATFSYQAKAALPEWATWLGLPSLTDGAAEIEGEAVWDSAENGLSYQGRMQVDNLVLEGDQLASEPVSLAAAYTGDASRLDFHDLEADALGGKLTGEVSILNLTAPGAARFRTSLALLDFPFDPLLAALAKLPTATPVPWTTALSGSIEAEGTGAADLEATLSLRLSRPAYVTPNRIPVLGTVEVRYLGSDRLLTADRIELFTPSGQVALSGSASPERETFLRVRVGMDALDDLLALAKAAGLQLAEMPFELKGKLQAEGELRGTLLAESPDLRFAGNVEANEFVLSGHGWKRFRSEVDVSPQQIEISDARLEDHTGSVDASLTVDLGDEGLAALWTGVPPPTSRWNTEGKVRFNDLPLATVLETTGRTEPVEGRLRGDIHFSGPADLPEGGVQLEIVEGRAWGEPFDHLRAGLRLDRETVSLESFEYARQDSRIEANGTLARATRRFQFDLDGRQWRLEELEAFSASKVRPSGELRFDLDASGGFGSDEELFDDLTVSGSLNLDRLQLDDKELGSFQAELQSEDRQVHLRWLGKLVSSVVKGSAEIQPTQGGPFSGECTINKLDVTHLARLGGLELEKLSGEVDSKFTFSGELARFGELSADGVVSRLEVAYSEIPGAERGYDLWNPFPMRWSIGDGKLDLDHVRLLGDGTDFELDGAVGLQQGLGQADDSLDLTLAGVFNLAVLESFRTGLEARGSSELEARIRGRFDDPRIEGSMQISDGNLRYAGFANGLSDLNGKLAFSERLIRIEELRAGSGGGTLRLSGTSLYKDDRWNYRLGADIERVRVRYPEDISSVIDGRLMFSGTDLQSLLAGELTVSRVAIGSGMSLGTVIASMAEPTQTPAANPALLNMQLSLSITSVPDLPLETSMVRNAQAQLNLRLRGTAVSPSLFGDVKLTQGQFVFQASRYTINRGDMNFYNPFRIEPVINFELETRIRDVDISLNLVGPASKINLSYRSDPPLRLDELVSLIAVGRSPRSEPILATQRSVEQQRFLQTGASAIFSQALSGRGGPGRIERFFGVSRLKVDPQAGGVESNPVARISTEQQVTDDLTFTYSYDLSQAQQQVIRVEWAPTRQWSFIVTRDENGLLGTDILFKKRLR
jgi:translocation and assembly module TamB